MTIMWLSLIDYIDEVASLALGRAQRSISGRSAGSGSAVRRRG
jgi:hypothetical protein